MSNGHNCHRCGRVTAWTKVRGGKRERCTGCGDVFPCRHECTHIDCAVARGKTSIIETPVGTVRAL